MGRGCFLLLGLLLAACSSSGNGSCQTTVSSVTYCTEYSGSGVTSDSTRTACSAVSGSFSASVCATANRVGRCTYVNGTVTAVSSFYMPTSASIGEQTCTVLMGTWAAD